jgi:hypothetical protein
MSHISDDEEGTRKNILSHLDNLQKKVYLKILLFYLRIGDIE